MISNKLRLFLIIFFTTFILASCRIKEKLSKEVVVQNIDEDIIINNVIENNLDFKTLYFKRTVVEFNDNGNIKTVRPNIYIENNEKIIVAITIPIVGGVRILIQPDQIIIIDYINKEVYYTNFDYIRRKFYFDLNYSLLQSILTNGLFSYPDENPLSIKGYSEQFVNGIYTFKNDNGSINFNQRIDIIAKDFKMSRNQIINPSENILFDVRYGDFKDLKDIKFPNSIRITAQKGYERYDLSMNCSNIEIDGSEAILFNIPESYEKVVLK